MKRVFQLSYSVMVSEREFEGTSNLVRTSGIPLVFLNICKNKNVNIKNSCFCNINIYILHLLSSFIQHKWPAMCIHCPIKLYYVSSSLYVKWKLKKGLFLILSSQFPIWYFVISVSLFKVNPTFIFVFNHVNTKIREI